MHGDCDPDDFSYEDAKKYIKQIPHCSVQVKTGTLVVFSNYQFIHRVLKMHYPSTENGDPKAPGGLASRDFLAFFVVDQRSPLSSTNELNPLLVTEKKNSNQIRKELFLDLLKPTGSFGVGGGVYSTGNGSVALLGWINDDMKYQNIDELYRKENDRSGLNNLDLFNQSPPPYRGLSWAVDEGNKNNVDEQNQM